MPANVIAVIVVEVGDAVMAESGDEAAVVLGGIPKLVLDHPMKVMQGPNQISKNS